MIIPVHQGIHWVLQPSSCLAARASGYVRLPARPHRASKQRGLVPVGARRVEKQKAASPATPSRAPAEPLQGHPAADERVRRGNVFMLKYADYIATFVPPDVPRRRTWSTSAQDRRRRCGEGQLGGRRTTAARLRETLTGRSPPRYARFRRVTSYAFIIQALACLVVSAIPSRASSRPPSQLVARRTSARRPRSRRWSASSRNSRPSRRRDRLMTSVLRLRRRLLLRVAAFESPQLPYAKYRYVAAPSFSPCHATNTQNSNAGTASPNL